MSISLLHKLFFSVLSFSAISRSLSFVPLFVFPIFSFVKTTSSSAPFSPLFPPEGVSRSIYSFHYPFCNPRSFTRAFYFELEKFFELLSRSLFVSLPFFYYFSSLSSCFSSPFRPKFSVWVWRKPLFSNSGQTFFISLWFRQEEVFYIFHLLLLAWRLSLSLHSLRVWGGCKQFFISFQVGGLVLFLLVSFTCVSRVVQIPLESDTAQVSLGLIYMPPSRPTLILSNALYWTTPKPWYLVQQAPLHLDRITYSSKKSID